MIAEICRNHCVNHVLVNDPTRGYGIFIENMLSETEKMK
ncbi:MAG: hypothetical protein E7635_02970 [Ruminococcaceae bacterium]|nr:hypothetical protein [Oscillospiraceae bacterium]